MPSSTSAVRESGRGLALRCCLHSLDHHTGRAGPRSAVNPPVIEGAAAWRRRRGSDFSANGRRKARVFASARLCETGVVERAESGRARRRPFRPQDVSLSLGSDHMRCRRAGRRLGPSASVCGIEVVACAGARACRPACMAQVFSARSCFPHSIAGFWCDPYWPGFKDALPGWSAITARSHLEFFSCNPFVD